MSPLVVSASMILRRRQVEQATGFSRSTIYLRIKQGLLTQPVRLGARAVGWPASEVLALNNARIAGLSENEVRRVVDQLHAARADVRV